MMGTLNALICSAPAFYTTNSSYRPWQGRPWQKSIARRAGKKMLAEIVLQLQPSAGCRQREARGPAWVAISRCAKGTSI